MKFNALALAALPAVAVAVSSGSVKRQSAEASTDELLFSVSLPTFISRRDALDPPGLDWSSNSCSYSPDNPFGFPFECVLYNLRGCEVANDVLSPACMRHDFGYRNYKAQDRFTDAGKLSIDDNFKDEYV